MNIKISKIKNKSESLNLEYLISGSKRSLSSEDKLSEGFLKAMQDLVPVALRMCELKHDLEGFVLTGISIARKETEEGENKSVVLSIKKAVKSGTLNISTPKRWLECDKEDADVLDDISQNAIQELCSHASQFVRNDSINTQLYSQAELSLGENQAAMES